MLYKQASPEIIQSYITLFYSKKLLFCNYYGTDLSDVDFIVSDNTLLLRKPYELFYRIYILSTNEDDLISILKEVDYNHAINIPSKKSIHSWEDVMLKANFHCLAVYNRFYYPSIESRGKFIEDYALINDLEKIYSILYANFSPITDRLPSKKELGTMILNKQIIVNRKNNEVSGLFIFSFEKNKCYFNAWIDLNGNGLSLVFNAFNMLAERDINYAYLWVKEGNIVSSKTHEVLGAVPDGLKDYTFLKR